MFDHVQTYLIAVCGTCLRIMTFVLKQYAFHLTLNNKRVDVVLLIIFHLYLQCAGQRFPEQLCCAKYVELNKV